MHSACLTIAKLRSGLRSGLVCAALAGILAAAPLVDGVLRPAAAQSRPGTKAVEGGAALKRMKVTVNKSQTLRLDAAFTDVLVGSSEIADVIPLSDQTLYVLGKKTGTTNVSVLDSSRRVVAVVDVEVGLDAASLASKIREGSGGDQIEVESQSDKIILRGRAADAQTVDRAVSVAAGLAPGGVVNATSVASPQQVMLKVRFLEAQRNAGRDLGFRLEYQGRNRAGRIGISDITGGALQGAIPFATVVTELLGNNTRQLDLFISALEERGVVRRLAEPNLTALSGDTANFLAGGEYPIPVNSTTTSGIPTITIAYKEYGVSLSFTPTVLKGGLINLQVAPEVSELDATNAVTVGGVSVPAIIKRRARTTVELRDGQSFVVAGLLQTQSQRQIEQLPWLGSVPVLGALFRSSSYQQNETELIVIVTPHLVRPSKPGDAIASPLDRTLPPNDPEFFLGGITEVQKGRNEFVRTRGAALGPHGHILTAPATVPAVRTGVTR